MVPNMLTKVRGYATPHVVFRTTQRERGLFGYPNDLYVTKNDPTTELDYDEWCKSLANHGVNLVRIDLNGQGWVWGPDRMAVAFEPPPHGTFNLWRIILQPDKPIQYVENQVKHPIPPETWERSNLGQLVMAAKRYGIKFSVVPFDNLEFRRWTYHAWNRNNKYLTGEPCRESDRGFLEDVTQVFTDPQARAAAKVRLQFLIDLFTEHDVVAYWHLCSEMPWLATDAQFWGLTQWNEPFRRVVVREKLVPWVEEMARYIQDRHPAPVGNGQVFWGSRDDWPSDPDHMINVVNEIFAVPSLDVVSVNWYQSGDVKRAHHWLRLCQERFKDKQIVVEQYAPYTLRRSEPWQGEAAPYKPSKRLEWAAACGEYGVVGPIRWMGIREESTVHIWATGGYADPGMQEIAGVTHQFAESVDLEDWAGRGQSYDNQITSPGLDTVSSWGDGQHVTMMLSWAEDGAKAVTVGGLEDREYELVLFDWVTGQPKGTQQLSANQKRVTFNATPGQDRIWVGYLRRRGLPPVPGLVEPVDGASIAAETVTFSWADVQAASYNLRVGQVVHTSSEPSMKLALNPGVHQWSVQALDSAGRASEYSEPWTVTVTEPPPPSVNLVVHDQKTGEVKVLKLEQNRTYVLTISQD